MYMREEDICREYRQAKDKQVQIGILAEQNLCSREEIAAVLARGGEEVPPWSRGVRRAERAGGGRAATAGIRNGPRRCIMRAGQTRRSQRW